MAIALAIIAILLVSVCSCWDLNGLKTEFEEFKTFATEKFEFLEAENVKKNGEIQNLKEENSKLEKKLQLFNLNFQQETSKTQTISADLEMLSKLYAPKSCSVLKNHGINESR